MGSLDRHFSGRCGVTGAGPRLTTNNDVKDRAMGPATATSLRPRAVVSGLGSRLGTRTDTR